MVQVETQVDQPCDQYARVETLLIELSARFISLAPEDVDHEIHDAQRKICEYLGFDRSSLFQVPVGNPVELLLTHMYQRPGMTPPPPGKPDMRRLFPWSLEQVRQGKTIILSKLDDLPAEAARDKESWQRYGTGSVVAFPLPIGRGGLGAVTFASNREREGWPETLLKRLQLVAEVFGNALARASSDLALRESEARLQITVDCAGAGLWDVSVESGQVWTTARLRELFGFDADKEIDYESFLNVIHPEDRSLVREAVRHSVEAKAALRLEFRILLPDQSVRWISARGGVTKDPRGESDRVVGVSIDITERKESEERLRSTLQELQNLREQLQQQNTYLKQEVKSLHGYSHIIGQSQALKRVLAQVEQVAPTGSTVLLLGETGAGKELIASAIHESSPRRSQPMVCVNCSAIPISLIESELFGREKGAYTGALSKQIGRFELANGSTLFLDEIGDLPPEIQVKLLRVLQEKQIERLGSPKGVPVDVRIIAATNHDLEKAVREERFRQDLYYRLNVFPIKIPALRERPEDIPALVSAFIGEFNLALGKNIESVARESMDALQRYDWPGNVRELRNIIERAMIVAREPKLWIEPPGTSGAGAGITRGLTMDEVAREHVCHVLKMTGWRVRGKNGAAEILGVKPTTLETRMIKLGIHRRTENPTQ
jgi:formate hydrogenlyase transcriptional activator